MLLHIENLAYGYGGEFSLHLKNLSLPQDCCVLLSGPNGSGKTTLLYLLSGIIGAKKYEIKSKLEPGEIILLGQENFLYPQLTVRENLLFWTNMEIALQDKKNAKFNQIEFENILTRLKLADIAEEKIQTLSLGTRQRVGLARLALSKARLILLDEPETGLDKQFMEQLIIETTLKPDSTIIWASHTVSKNQIYDGVPIFSHILQLVQSTDHSEKFTGKIKTLIAKPEQTTIYSHQSQHSMPGENRC